MAGRFGYNVNFFSVKSKYVAKWESSELCHNHVIYAHIIGFLFFFSMFCFFLIRHLVTPVYTAVQAFITSIKVYFFVDIQFSRSQKI